MCPHLYADFQISASQHLNRSGSTADQPRCREFDRADFSFSQPPGLEVSHIGELIYLLESLVGKPDLWQAAVQGHLTAREPGPAASTGARS